MKRLVSVDVSAVPPKPAGAGRYIVEMVSRLSSREEFDLGLIVRSNDQQRWADIAPGAAVIAQAPAKRPLRLLWEQLRLPHVLSRSKVSLHWAPHYTMPERSDIPRLVTIHDMTFFSHPEWHEQSKAYVFRRAIQKAASSASLLTVSEHTRRQLLDLFPDASAASIPLGVDHQKFSSALDATDAEILKALGVKAPYVFFVGTIEPRKDVPTLLRAFDRVADKYGDLRLVIAGQPGWGVELFNTALANLKHKSRVDVVGYVDDSAVPVLLRNSAAVAYPSLFEGFGLPALEALACGAPLVTTRDTPMEEVVGDCALLVDAGAVDQLAEAIDRLISEPVLAGRLRFEGPKRAGWYTWDRTADAHCEHICEMLDATPT